MARWTMQVVCDLVSRCPACLERFERRGQLPALHSDPASNAADPGTRAQPRLELASAGTESDRMHGKLRLTQSTMDLANRPSNRKCDESRRMLQNSAEHFPFESPTAGRIGLLETESRIRLARLRRKQMSRSAVFANALQTIRR